MLERQIAAGRELLDAQGVGGQVGDGAMMNTKTREHTSLPSTLALGSGWFGGALKELSALCAPTLHPAIEAYATASRTRETTAWRIVAIDVADYQDYDCADQLRYVGEEVVQTCS
jgi:hypothetical protein